MKKSLLTIALLTAINAYAAPQATPIGGGSPDTTKYAVAVPNSIYTPSRITGDMSVTQSANGHINYINTLSVTDTPTTAADIGNNFRTMANSYFTNTAALVRTTDDLVTAYNGAGFQSSTGDGMASMTGIKTAVATVGGYVTKANIAIDAAYLQALKAQLPTTAKDTTAIAGNTEPYYYLDAAGNVMKQTVSSNSGNYKYVAGIQVDADKVIDLITNPNFIGKSNVNLINTLGNATISFSQ